MYAIIRTGGKQAKVREGDVIDVERLRGEGEVSFTPLLVVDDKGGVTSGRDELAEAKVVAKILGPAQGPKIDVFKYKPKTGYRRRQGHRQKYTRIEVTKIELAKAEVPAKKPVAKKSSAEKPATKKATGQKAAAASSKKIEAGSKSAPSPKDSKSDKED